MKNIQEWEKEFDKRFNGEIRIWFSSGCSVSSKDYSKNIKSFIRELLAKSCQELLEEIKNGTICLNCGGKKEGKLTDWCDKCLENG